MREFCLYCWDHTKQTRVWLRGLRAAIVGGVSADFSLYFMDHKDFSFTRENIANLEHMALVGAFIAVVHYMAQSPLSGANTQK